MKRLCVFLGSNPGTHPDYAAAARAVGEALARRGVGLVYGGGKVGLMGVLADAALAAGGVVTGVIPHALLAREVAHPGLTELRVVDSMHERKSLMGELADGFLALPGGFGTFEELLEIITWAQLGLHKKPCGLFNVNGYFDHLLAFLDHAVGEGFLKPEHRSLVLVGQRPEELLDRFDGYEPPAVEKWIGRDET